MHLNVFTPQVKVWFRKLWTANPILLIQVNSYIHKWLCMHTYSSCLAVLVLVRWLVLPANGIEMVIRAN